MDNNQNTEQFENPQQNQKPRTEEFTINGDQLIGRIKELLHEGDIRQITIKNEDGQDGAAIIVAAAPATPMVRETCQQQLRRPRSSS